MEAPEVTRYWRGRQRIRHFNQNIEEVGRLRKDPYLSSPSGQRRFYLTDIKRITPREIEPLSQRITINYARVSSHDQREDLIRQARILEAFSAANGWQYETIQDFGSGLNYQKRGLQKLLKRIMRGDVGRLVLTHKDRLLRFGAEIVFAICEEFEPCCGNYQQIFLRGELRARVGNRHD